VDGIYADAQQAGVITAQELEVIRRKGELRDKVIRVDDFPYDFDLREALADLSDEDQQQRREAA